MLVIVEKNIAYKLFITKNEKLFYRKNGLYYKVNEIKDLKNRVFLKLNKDESKILRKMDTINSFTDTFAILGAISSSIIILTFLFLNKNNIIDMTINEWWSTLTLQVKLILPISFIVTHFSWHQIFFCSNFSDDYLNKYTKQKNEIINKYIS